MSVRLARRYHLRPNIKEEDALEIGGAAEMESIWIIHGKHVVEYMEITLALGLIHHTRLFQKVLGELHSHHCEGQGDSIVNY